MKKLVYLATPYTHEDKAVEEWRFKMVNAKAAELMSQGLIIFSPISHTHPIALAGDLPVHWEFWETFDKVFLNHSYKLMVLMLDGWKQSRGVAAEIEMATKLGLEIEYINP